jgi:hypothetical protein
MSHPAAPATTIVTVVSSGIWLRGQRRKSERVRHILSAILKTSQPRPAKLNPQRTITTIIVLTSVFTG